MPRPLQPVVHHEGEEAGASGHTSLSPGVLSLRRLPVPVQAPLLTGADPTSFTAVDLAVLTNADAVSINQDPLGIQASV